MATLLQDYLIESARSAPAGMALVADGQRLTYGELDAQSNALARALRRGGVERGDRVLIFGDNAVPTAVSFWAALKADAVPAVINAGTRAERLAWLLNDSRATALIAQGHLAPAFTAAAPRSPHLRARIVAGEPGQPLEGWTRWDDAIQGENDDTPPPRRCIDQDLASIIYTSGSTGDPKGVMLTHANMLAAATSISTYLGLAQDEVILCALPLSFDYGLYQMIMGFRMGARVLLEKGFAFPARVLERVVEEGVTAFPGVPTMFATMAEMKSLPSYDFRRIRIVTNTAAALPVKHIRMLRELFPAARIFSMYGLTECKRCTYLPPEDIDRKPWSVGVAIPNTELWIVDDQDRRVGPGVVGQLVIRGATVMRGYWEKPEATAERLRPGPLPGERVLYTGDYCRLDEEGYLTFVGRMDDIIKSRGEKVAPKEVENALVDVPGVKEAAVVGVPDEILGEAVKAFVVLEQGSPLGPRELLRECQKRLEPFKVPKEIVLRSELPRTTTGKIRKTGLT